MTKLEELAMLAGITPEELRAYLRKEISRALHKLATQNGDEEKVA